MTQQPHPPGKTLNRRQWQAHIQAFRRSGLNRAEYCRQHNLSYHALAYWQRKLSAPEPAKEYDLVPVSIKPLLMSKNNGADRASLRVVLPGGCTIEVGDDFSPATLSRLLTTLEAR
jgi:hypothetical protein